MKSLFRTEKSTEIRIRYLYLNTGIERCQYTLHNMLELYKCISYLQYQNHICSASLYSLLQITSSAQPAADHFLLPLFKTHVSLRLTIHWSLELCTFSCGILHCLHFLTFP
jgi:hypothetical protein